MVKKLILLICAISLATLPTFAQMSDEAIVTYVNQAMAAGKSQAEIAKALAARGVTPEQAERIKQKFMTEEESKDQATKVAGAQEYQRREGQSVMEEDTLATQVLDNKIADQINVYGRNIFTSRNLTFAPNINLPTPVNYVLGPGDEVIIDIWGTNQASIRRTISPDGMINIPDLGLVNLNGMSINQAEAFMKRKLGQIYSVDGENAKSEIKLTLGSIRSIQVNIMGEVANPGTYYLSSLSNIYHALYTAGGVSQLGSLRNVQLIRRGKVVAKVDIYDFILNGNMGTDVILEEGDIVNVPTYDIIVDLTGNVKRPMSYEMKQGETVADVIRYAAGFTGDAYTKNISIVRQDGSEYQIFTVDQPDYDTFKLMEGDVLTVGAMLDRYKNKIEIKGAVYRPGVYQLGNGINTLKDLIEKAEGLKGDAFTNRALITREREDLTLEMVQVNVAAVLAGSDPDLELVKNDIVYIPSIHDLKDVGAIIVDGEVAKPGSFVYAENTTLEDAIMMAGGLLESASTVKIDINRRIKNSSSMEETDSIGHFFTFAFKDGYILDGEPGFLLEPYDQVIVRPSPGYATQTNVTIYGEAVFPGKYILTNKQERLTDLVKKAGGLNSWAYIKGARLLRYLTPEEQLRENTINNLTKTVGDTLTVNSEEDFYGRVNVAINLEKAMANPGSEADIILRSGDYLIVPEYNNTVTITGNVMYPNVVSYDKTMRVRDYVENAGGYGFRSKKTKSYIIYMNGTVARVRGGSKKLVEPGCQIIITKKQDKSDNLQKILSVSTTAASLGTMIATIGNMLK